MNTRKITNEYRLTQWTQTLRERTESGLNIREFCAERGILETTFYYWQRKLRETAAISAAPHGWAAITEAETAKSTPLSVEIGDFKVAVDSDTDTALLAKTLKLLKELC
jgi:transposase-like protein